MEEPEPVTRRQKISTFFENLHRTENKDNVLVISSLWNIAMWDPNNPEFPSLGIFECMARLIQKGVNDTEWLLKDQNIYIPYYAAHIIGSYTMNNAEFAEMGVQSGIIPPLMELLRGKLSWVEQRVAARALGHLASYEITFLPLAEYEEEVVRLAMHVSSTCLQVVYDMFVKIEERGKRERYHSDLLTRGVGGIEIENRKAEEWASQLQCWSLYLLNCFAYKNRCLDLICRPGFLRNLCMMWGGLVNDVSPAGYGLIRILCYRKYGRKCISEVKQVIESLGNLSRSSDDWQYIGIDCLLLLLKDQVTRSKVIDTAIGFLVDLVELKTLRGNSKTSIGQAIINIIFQTRQESKVKACLDEVNIMMGRRKREKTISEEKKEEMRVVVNLIKHQGNKHFWSGEVEEAIEKYSEGLVICPMKLKRERIVLFSNRAQCHLLLRDPDAVIRDTTRALCLTTPPNSHSKSLWRRSQAYDMKGLAKESLMDCIMFLNCCIQQKSTNYVKIPYHAARMISKQMEATWLFNGGSDGGNSSNDDQSTQDDEMMGTWDHQGLEQPLIAKAGSERGREWNKRRNKAAIARTM